MTATGMIFQYNSDEGAGLVMLSDGETKEFNEYCWVDTENSPAVGQKISYEDSYGRIQIKVFKEEVCSDSAASQNEEDELQLGVEQFTNLDDCVAYYTGAGFKLVSDSTDDEVRIVIIRLYTPEDYGEVTIKQTTSEINVIQVLNGKKELFCISI